MKTFSCGTQIHKSLYYFVLDFNDRDEKVTISNLFGKYRLQDLTYEEFKIVYRIACESQLPEAFK